MRLVIGLVGRISSGKTIVSEYLSEVRGAGQYRFSQILIDVLERLYLPPDRTHLQRLGASIRHNLGEDTIVEALKKDMDNDDSNLLVIDGIRYWNEVNMLRTFKSNALICLTAPPEARFKRSKDRAEKGEENITFEQFLESEKQETEKLINEIGRDADYIIENTGTKKELFDNVEKILEKEGYK